jgi:hypothetical protein
MATSDDLAGYFAGLGYNPVQIAGIVGNLQAESGLNPTATGDNGTSYGLAQWHNDRWDALNKFAANNGTQPSDPLTQARFIDFELKNNEPTAYSALQGAKTPADAAAAFIHFERPQGYSPDNPLGAMGASDRVANAQAFASGQPFGGPSPRQATQMAAGRPSGLLAPSQPSQANGSDGLLGGLLAQRQPGQPQATQDSGPAGLLQVASLQPAQIPKRPMPSFGAPKPRPAPRGFFT